jgi:hypothetical protein
LIFYFLAFSTKGKQRSVVPLVKVWKIANKILGQSTSIAEVMTFWVRHYVNSNKFYIPHIVVQII